METKPAMEKSYLDRISYSELIQWDKLKSRREFPWLVKLLCLQNPTLSRCEFLANESCEYPGIDGITECTHGDAYVPEGNTFWEVGTNENYEKKANEDYEKRTNDPKIENKANTTFVIVTLREWKQLNKEKWIEKKRREKSGRMFG